jgi:cytochrome c oxidase assembly factor CtaG
MSAPSLPSLLVSHWQLTASVAVPAAAMGALYVVGAQRAGGWPVRRTASYLSGVGCVVVALQSGIDSYDDRLLSVHMVQHMLLLLVAPLLLLGGRPVVLLLSALPPGRRRAAGKLLIRLRACR